MGGPRSTNSRKTGKSGRTGVSKSRKSRNEMEDFEGMEIEEVQSRIDQAEYAMKGLEKSRAKILKKATTAVQREQNKKDL
jgi:beta-lactam-binding protein with PASTA domain